MSAESASDRHQFSRLTGRSYIDLNQPLGAADFLKAHAQQSEEHIWSGDDAISGLFRHGVLSNEAVNDLAAFIQEHGFLLIDLYVLLLVDDIRKEPEALISLGSFRASKFTESLGIADSGHTRNIYFLLRRWMGPDNPYLGRTELKRRGTYLKLLSEFPHSPNVAQALLSPVADFEGNRYESFMLLDRGLVLKYFGVSVIIRSYLCGRKAPIGDMFNVDLSKSFNILTCEEERELEKQGKSFDQVLDQVIMVQEEIRRCNALIVSSKLSKGLDIIIILNKSQLVNADSALHTFLEVIPEATVVELKYRHSFRSTAYKFLKSRVSTLTPNELLSFPVDWKHIRHAASSRMGLYYHYHKSTPELPRFVFSGFAGIDAMQRNASQLLQAMGIQLNGKPLSSLFLDARAAVGAALDNDLVLLRRVVRDDLTDNTLSNLLAVLRFQIGYFESNNILQTISDGRYLHDLERGLLVRSTHALTSMKDKVRSSISLVKAENNGEWELAPATELPLYDVVTTSGEKCVLIDSEVFDRPVQTPDGLIFGPLICKENGRFTSLSTEDVRSLGGMVFESVDQFRELLSEVNVALRIYNERTQSSEFPEIEISSFNSFTDVTDLFEREDFRLIPLYNFICLHILFGLFAKRDRRYGLKSLVNSELACEFSIMGVDGQTVNTLWKDILLHPMVTLEFIRFNYGATRRGRYPLLFNRNGFAEEFYTSFMYLVKSSAPAGLRLFGSQRMGETHYQRLALDESLKPAKIGSKSLKVIYHNKRYSLFTVLPPADEVSRRVFEMPFLREVYASSPGQAIEHYLHRRLLGFDNELDKDFLQADGMEQEYLMTFNNEFVIPRPDFTEGAGGMGVTFNIYKDHAVVTKRTFSTKDVRIIQNRDLFIQISEDSLRISQDAFSHAFSPLTSYREYSRIFKTYNDIINCLEMIHDYVDKNYLKELNEGLKQPFKTTSELWNIMCRIYTGVPSTAMRNWDHSFEQEIKNLFPNGFHFKIDPQYQENSFVTSLFLEKNTEKLTFYDINLGRSQHKLTGFGEEEEEVIRTAYLYQINKALRYNVLTSSQIRSNTMAWRAIHNEKTRMTIPQVLLKLGYTKHQASSYTSFLGHNFIAPRSVVTSTELYHPAQFTDVKTANKFNLRNNTIAFGKLFATPRRVIARNSTNYILLTTIQKLLHKASNFKSIYTELQKFTNTFGVFVSNSHHIPIEIIKNSQTNEKM